MILPIVKCFLLIWVFFLRETLKSLKFKTKYTNFIRQSKVYSIHYFCLHCFLLIAKSCPTLCNPMDCSPPASSAHGFSQARILSGFSFLAPIFFFLHQTLLIETQRKQEGATYAGVYKLLKAHLHNTDYKCLNSKFINKWMKVSKVLYYCKITLG